jgi:hypothetical protein
VYAPRGRCRTMTWWPATRLRPMGSFGWVGRVPLYSSEERPPGTLSCHAKEFSDQEPTHERRGPFLLQIAMAGRVQEDTAPISLSGRVSRVCVGDSLTSYALGHEGEFAADARPDVAERPTRGPSSGTARCRCTVRDRAPDLTTRLVVEKDLPASIRHLDIHGCFVSPFSALGHTHLRLRGRGVAGIDSLAVTELSGRLPVRIALPHRSTLRSDLFT